MKPLIENVYHYNIFRLTAYYRTISIVFEKLTLFSIKISLLIPNIFFRTFIHLYTFILQAAGKIFGILNGACADPEGTRPEDE